MSTIATTLPVSRRGGRRSPLVALRDGLRRRRLRRGTPPELRALTARMLDDIGVPEALIARIEAERAPATAYRDATRLGPFTRR